VGSDPASLGAEPVSSQRDGARQIKVRSDDLFDIGFSSSADSPSYRTVSEHRYTRVKHVCDRETMSGASHTTRPTPELRLSLFSCRSALLQAQPLTTINVVRI
jgi:hypothetical protein